MGGDIAAGAGQNCGAGDGRVKGGQRCGGGLVDVRRQVGHGIDYRCVAGDKSGSRGGVAVPARAVIEAFKLGRRQAGDSAGSVLEKLGERGLGADQVLLEDLQFLIGRQRLRFPCDELLHGFGHRLADRDLVYGRRQQHIDRAPHAALVEHTVLDRAIASGAHTQVERDFLVGSRVARDDVIRVRHRVAHAEPQCPRLAVGEIGADPGFRDRDDVLFPQFPQLEDAVDGGPGIAFQRCLQGVNLGLLLFDGAARLGVGDQRALHVRRQYILLARHHACYASHEIGARRGQSHADGLALLVCRLHRHRLEVGRADVAGCFLGVGHRFNGELVADHLVFQRAAHRTGVDDEFERVGHLA